MKSQIQTKVDELQNKTTSLETSVQDIIKTSTEQNLDSRVTQLETNVSSLQSEVVPATTTSAGLVQLNDTVTSASTTEAATANAVKTAYDKAVEAQSSASGGITSTDVPVYAAPDVSRAVLVSIPLNTDTALDPYVPPVDGFISVRGVSAGNNTNSYHYLYEVSSSVYLFQAGNIQGYGTGATIPVHTSMQLRQQIAGITNIYTYFIPAVGTEWSA